MTPTLDVVINLRDLSELPMLDRALFTVFGQVLDVPVDIHVMLPRFSVQDLCLVRRMTDGLRSLSPSANLRLHNWGAPGPLDLRAALLNWSVEIATGRHYTVLTVTDLLAAGALRHLLDVLRHNDVALVEAPLTSQSVLWWGDAVVPMAVPGPQQREAGICFMIDRSRLPLRDLLFTSGSSDETERLLSSIRSRHRAMQLSRETPLGVRQYPL